MNSSLSETSLSQNLRADSLSEIVFVYGTAAGVGGLGIQSANAAASLVSKETTVHALGPGHVDRWPLSSEQNIHWHESPSTTPSRFANYSLNRWRPGGQQFDRDCRLGRWAVEQTKVLNPEKCYVFTQVGLEVLKWAKQNGVPSVLESPNGHIRNFREVYEAESARWCGQRFHGHPSPEMVERVEQEYELADRIRVSSEWSKNTMVDRGVPTQKIHVLKQPVDLELFQPAGRTSNVEGPLRICFVGSLDLRKGFIYLLQAMRLIGPERISLEIVGATGTRCCARLFAKEACGLTVTAAPGDPLPAYHRAEVFVLPTLEDGSPFVVAEAMACGLPVIVTDSCGSAEWIREGSNGWIVPSRKPEALAQVLETALLNRQHLKSMGTQARLDTERRAGLSCFLDFQKWLHET